MPAACPHSGGRRRQQHHCNSTVRCTTASLCRNTPTPQWQSATERQRGRCRMPERGLEPPPSYLDKNLNLARLPIPPLGRGECLSACKNATSPAPPSKRHHFPTKNPRSPRPQSDSEMKRDGSAGAEGTSAQPRPLRGPWTRPACGPRGPWTRPAYALLPPAADRRKAADRPSLKRSARGEPGADPPA